MTDSIRDIARKSGLPPATVHRFRTGQNVSLQTAAKMRPFVENCPCCGVSQNPIAEAVEADRRRIEHLVFEFIHGSRHVTLGDNLIAAIRQEET